MPKSKTTFNSKIETYVAAADLDRFLSVCRTKKATRATIAREAILFYLDCREQNKQSKRDTELLRIPAQDIVNLVEDAQAEATAQTALTTTADAAAAGSPAVFSSPAVLAGAGAGAVTTAALVVYLLSQKVPAYAQQLQAYSNANVEGLRGNGFEAYLTNLYGGRGPFKEPGRSKFDGTRLNDAVYFEAKSGTGWFTCGWQQTQGQLAREQAHALEAGKQFELHVNAVPTGPALQWLQNNEIPVIIHLNSGIYSVSR